MRLHRKDKIKNEREQKVEVYPEYRYKYDGNAIKALELDKKCCAYKCKNTTDLIVHHYNKNKKDNRLENLVTLCRSCHTKLHNLDRDLGNKNKPLYDRIQLSGVVLFTIKDAINNLLKRRQLVFNLVVTTGRTVLASWLGNVTGSPTTLYPNYVALGTGVTAPANGDTTLQTETYRNLVASRTNASNIAYITGFFNATETSGTFREAGLFIAGTGAANSGTLFSRVAINITKAVTETLTLDWQITFS